MNPACWNCPPEKEGTMKRIAVDAFYFYYQCQACGKESMELRDDRPTGSKEYEYLFQV